MSYSFPFLRLPLLAALALGTAAPVAQAQSTLLQPPPQNVLLLSAEAQAEVVQDLLTITLQVVREGADASVVQSGLRQVLDAALTEARKAQRPGQLEVRTGTFTVYPRTSPKGGIAGWQGQAELVLEGRDLAAISALAGRLPGLVVARASFGLSREARERAAAEVAAEAIGRFRARASSYGQQFGFGGWSLREVTVGSGDVAPPVMQPMLRMRAAAAPSFDEAQPVEAGKATVSASVSGSIQLSPR